jgi:hypothetical protein
MNLTVDDLITRLRGMSAEAIRHVAHTTRGQGASAADEIAWWSARLRVERVLRRAGRRIEAASAATMAARAVRQAALRAGLSLGGDDVVRAARSASDAASALVAGPEVASDAAFLVGRLGITSPDDGPRPAAA